MSNTAANLRHKINSASDLQGVVRTMKALAASSISQYEQSVRALADYYRTVELGLSACVRASEPAAAAMSPSAARPNGKPRGETFGVIVFGSDQGLVGRFNEEVADFAISTLATLPGTPQVWAVGERVHARLSEAGLSMMQGFSVPTNVNDITPLVGHLQIENETHGVESESAGLYVFHNHPTSGALYEPVSQRVLPLDWRWQQGLAAIPWPTGNLPEILCTGSTTLRALIREHLFISLYRACAESLASENASRLAAMQRAEKNIGELLQDLASEFHQLRQSSIDEELFDVVAGYELLENGQNESPGS